MLAQLLNRSCNSPDAVFRTIRDFLAAADGIDDFTAGGDNPGPGYEIVDAFYSSGSADNTTSGDWCVLRSTGEAGSYPHYLQLLFGVSQHTIKASLGWDPAAGAGFAVAYRQANIYHNGAGEVILYIYADLDECHIVIRPRGSNNWYWHPFGRLKPDGGLFYDGSAVQVAEAVAAGDNVALELPSWPSWARAGKKIYNWDGANLRELVIAQADEASGIITVETAWDMAAGSWLAEDLFVFVNSAHGNSAGANNGITGVPARAGANLTAPVTHTLVLPELTGWEEKYGLRLCADIWAQGGMSMRGRFALARVSRWTPDAQGEAWVDENGRNWRLHRVQSNVGMAFREAD